MITRGMRMGLAISKEDRTILRLSSGLYYRLALCTVKAIYGEGNPSRKKGFLGFP